jgi:DNA-binding transcriptional regulator YbjK
MQLDAVSRMFIASMHSSETVHERVATGMNLLQKRAIIHGKFIAIQHFGLGALSHRALFFRAGVGLPRPSSLV